MPQAVKPFQPAEAKKQAIDWLARLRADDLSDGEVRAFADWLAADAAHAEAFGAAEALFDEMTLAARMAPVREASETVPAAARRISCHSDKPSVRLRRRWAVSLAAAAVCLLAVNVLMATGGHPLAAWLSDYHTRVGELREFALSDGSRLLLDTASAVSVDFAEDRREIRLLHGQARFAVAKDPKRPFIVAANGLNVRALGTVFAVKSENGRVTVTVQAHRVAAKLASHRTQPISEVQIAEGQRLEYRPGQPLPPPEPAPAEQSSAWQQHRLMVNDRPLSELIKELDRYRTGRILLGDERLENLRITGVFALDDPDKVLRSVSNALALRQTRIGPWWVLLHR